MENPPHYTLGVMTSAWLTAPEPGSHAAQFKLSSALIFNKK
jgi:hypothetical protein